MRLLSLSLSFSRIGLCGFDNPMRGPKTDELKRQIGQVNKSKIRFFFIYLICDG